MDYITRLKQKEEFEYWLGADNEQILYIENELNIKLPKQYKRDKYNQGYYRYIHYNNRQDLATCKG